MGSSATTWVLPVSIVREKVASCASLRLARAKEGVTLGEASGDDATASEGAGDGDWPEVPAGVTMASVAATLTMMIQPRL